ncbi:hypothetical protein F4780DRAFT_456419 [Xylariomycetidae sp. FL0641]|nr:hypothetical protein F4780DRAFT_456419 [Xylariomycetidae sp. FL0641]
MTVPCSKQMEDVSLQKASPYASTETETETGYNVQQVLALDQPELVQLVKDCLTDQGMVDITCITDWDEAPDAEIRELEKRISDATPLARAPQAPDLSGLADRLADVAEGRARWRRSVSRDFAIIAAIEAREGRAPPHSPRQPTPPPLPAYESEFRFYHDLVANGGQPACEFEMVQEVYENPKAHENTLQPWLEDHTTMPLYSNLGLLRLQWYRWVAFRKFQRISRGVDLASEDNFPSYLDEKRHFNVLIVASAINEWDDFEDIMRTEWKKERMERESLQKALEDVRVGGLAKLVQDMRRRLASHGFSQPFDLLQDPQQQDRRTTWIEYLNFECWWLYQYIRRAQYFQKELEKGHPINTKQQANAQTREANHRLLVQWVLSKMPPPEEPRKSNTKTKPAVSAGKSQRRADHDEAVSAGKRQRRADHDEAVSAGKRQRRVDHDEAAAGPTKPTTERQKRGKGADTQLAIRTRVRNSAGLRRSARINSQNENSKDGRRKSG